MSKPTHIKIRFDESDGWLCDIVPIAHVSVSQDARHKYWVSIYGVLRGQIPDEDAAAIMKILMGEESAETTTAERSCLTCEHHAGFCIPFPPMCTACRHAENRVLPYWTPKVAKTQEEE